MAHKKILSKEITKPKYTSWDQLTEYRNLDMAREIAQHVEKGGKLWTFPYLRQILVIWGVFFRSLYLTTKKSRANGEKWYGGITSSYLVTNLFVLGMTTIEYSVKSLATTVVMLFMVIPQAYHSMMKKKSRKTTSNLEEEVKKLLHGYHEEIHSHPWFMCDFGEKMEQLKKEYEKPATKRSVYERLSDFFTYHILRIDFKFRKLIAPGVRSNFEIEDPDSVRGANTNFATSENGEKFLKLPVYDELTDWLYTAYCNKSVTDHNEKYDKPQKIHSLWGQQSMMCRMNISNDQVPEIKKLFKSQIEANFGNGVDDTRTIILDIPWNQKIKYQGEDRYAIELLMSKYYDPDKKNIHFHDPYVPQQQDVYARRLMLSDDDRETQDKKSFLQSFSHHYFSILMAGMINSYDKVRIYNKALRFLAHFSTMLILAALQSIAILVDLALSVVGMALAVPVMVVTRAWTVLSKIFKRDSDAFGRALEGFKANMRSFSQGLFNLWRSFFGYYDPSYLAHDLLKENNHKAVAGGGLYKTNLDVLYPRTEEEIQEIIVNAKKDDRICTVRGAGYSQGQQFLSNDGRQVVISLDHLKIRDKDRKSNIVFNDDNTVTCAAGAKWSDIQEVIGKHKRALPVMQASNIFSIGGSASTNIHGWNHHMGSLSNHIKAIRYIDEDGAIHSIGPEDKMFKYIVGGFGRFGVMVDITLSTVPNGSLKLQSHECNLSSYLEDFKSKIKNNKSVGMHVGRLPIHQAGKWGSKDCQLISSNYYDQGGEPVKDEDLYREKKGGNVVKRMLLNAMTRFSPMKWVFWQMERKAEMSSKNKVMSINETNNFEIQSMLRSESASKQFWLQEFFLPEEGIEAFTKELGHILDKNKVNLINASIRFVKKETQKTAMSYAPEDRYALVICFRQNMRRSKIRETHKWVQKAIDAAIKNGGTFYMPYQQFASQEQFDKAYPQASMLDTEYKEEIGKQKPNLFENGLGRRYMQRNSLDFIPNLDKMEGFFENVFPQYRFEDFRQVYNEELNKRHSSQKEVYKAVQRRMPEISGGPGEALLRKIKALYSIQNALCEQAKEICQADIRSLPEEAGKGLEIGTFGRFVPRMAEQFGLSKVDVLAEEANKPSRLQLATEHRDKLTLLRGQKKYEAGDKKTGPTFDLNYNNISNIDFKGNKYKVITCFAGAHHFPEEQLDDFFRKIQDALLPGGKFLLVEHDKRLAEGADTSAHSIFNLGSSVDHTENENEIRNFQDIRYWVDKVQEAAPGLEIIRHERKGEKEIMRKERAGDPSRNTMIGFSKRG